MDPTERLAAAMERVAEHLDAQEHERAQRDRAQSRHDLRPDIEAAARAEVRKALRENDDGMASWAVVLLWVCLVVAAVIVLRQPAENEAS